MTGVRAAGLVLFAIACAVYFGAGGGAARLGGTPAPPPAPGLAATDAPATGLVLPSPAPGTPTPPPGQYARIDADARAFANSYVAYLFSDARAASVVNVTDDVRAVLERGRAQISPPERGRPHALAAVGTTLAAGDALQVRAEVTEQGLAAFSVSYDMRYQGGAGEGRWVTTTAPVIGT